MGKQGGTRRPLPWRSFLITGAAPPCQRFISGSGCTAADRQRAQPGDEATEPAAAWSTRDLHPARGGQFGGHPWPWATCVPGAAVARPGGRRGPRDQRRARPARHAGAWRRCTRRGHRRSARRGRWGPAAPPRANRARYRLTAQPHSRAHPAQQRCTGYRVVYALRPGSGIANAAGRCTVPHCPLPIGDGAPTPDRTCSSLPRRPRQRQGAPAPLSAVLETVSSGGESPCRTRINGAAGHAPPRSTIPVFRSRPYVCAAHAPLPQAIRRRSTKPPPIAAAPSSSSAMLRVSAAPVLGSACAWPPAAGRVNVATSASIAASGPTAKTL